VPAPAGAGTEQQMKRATTRPPFKRRFSGTHEAVARADGEPDARDVRQRLAQREMELEEARATVRVKLEKIECEARLSADVVRRAGEAEVLRRQLEDLHESLECAMCMERPAAIALSCGHCYCCDAACVSANMQACPTCQAPILTRTKLFGGNATQVPSKVTAQPETTASGACDAACITSSILHGLSSLSGTHLVCYFTGRRHR